MNRIGDLTEIVLPTGLTLLMVPTPGCGVVTTDLWVAAGSADEVPEHYGMAHFLEHMLFKGTERRGVGDIDLEVESVGGDLNAATSHDYTHYYVTVPVRHFEMAMDIMADFAEFAMLDGAELDNEREVILEEYHRKQDSPGGLLWESLYDHVFDDGPYKHSVLGTPETLGQIDQDAMLRFYRRHYAPGNMAMIIVGDVALEDMRKVAVEKFGGFERAFEPELRSGERDAVYAAFGDGELRRDLHECYGALSWPAPALRDADEAVALDVLQCVLGEGHASMLYHEVKERRQLATNIGVSYGSGRFEDLFSVFYTAEDDKRDALREAVVEQVERVREGAILSSDVARARRLLANEHRFGLEQTTGQSGSIGYYFVATQSARFEREYVERVLAVKPEEVIEAARRWLDPAGMFGYAVCPR